MAVKLTCSGLYKAFGAHPLKVVEGLRAGITREALRESIGGVVALEDINLSIESGEIFILMGLSGSGKSTLIRCINRLVMPTEGSVLIDGEDITRCSELRLRELRRRKFSMVFQSFGLMPHLRVIENIEYGLMLRGDEPTTRRAKAREMLDLVGLNDWGRHFPETLSGGMRQRVGLARALASDCDILFMDEPFSALDPLIRKELQDQLLELQLKLRKTIVFVTHDFQEAVRIGNRMAVLRKGRVVQVGTPADMVLNPADDYVAAFSREIDRTKFISAGDVLSAAWTRTTGGSEPQRDASPDSPRVLSGDPLQELYPLLTRYSHVAVTDSHGSVLGHLSAGDVFSELSALNEICPTSGQNLTKAMAR